MAYCRIDIRNYNANYILEGYGSFSQWGIADYVALAYAAWMLVITVGLSVVLVWKIFRAKREGAGGVSSLPSFPISLGRTQGNLLTGFAPLARIQRPPQAHHNRDPHHGCFNHPSHRFHHPRLHGRDLTRRYACHPHASLPCHGGRRRHHAGGDEARHLEVGGGERLREGLETTSSRSASSVLGMGGVTRNLVSLDRRFWTGVYI